MYIFGYAFNYLITPLSIHHICSHLVISFHICLKTRIKTSLIKKKYNRQTIAAFNYELQQMTLIPPIPSMQLK